MPLIGKVGTPGIATPKAPPEISLLKLRPAEIDAPGPRVHREGMSSWGKLRNVGRALVGVPPMGSIAVAVSGI